MEHGAQVFLLDCRPLTDGALAPFEAWLGPSERDRLAGFIRPLRRRQFLAGRALLRQALAPLLGMPAHLVPLVERQGNAPLLDLNGTAEVGFSLSHSGEWVACAVGTAGPLGLDIEVMDPARDVAALAEQAFTPQETAWLARQPQATRPHDFYRLWCMHEARIKLGQATHHEYVLPHPVVAAVLATTKPLADAPVLLPATLPLA